MNGSHTGGADGGWGARGQSEVLGLVLLLGMVIAVGATVLFFGVAMLDSLESETVRDSVHQSLDSTVETMTSVGTDGDEVRELPLHDQADASYVADGEIRGGWYMDSDLEDGPPAYEDIDCQWSVSPLGALEYEYEDRTAVIQSGGIWESDGTDWRTHAEPTVNFVGTNASSLQISMSVMTIDKDEEQDLRHASVRAGDTDPADEFPSPSACKGPTPHGLIEIESSYADAWYHYLTGSTALGTADDDNLTVEQTGDTITIHIQGFADDDIDYPRVIRDEGMDETQKLVDGDHFEVEAVLENKASEPVTTCDFILDVLETDFELDGGQTPGHGDDCDDIGPGESLTNTFWTPPADQQGTPGYDGHLEPGTVYEYTIYPVDEDGTPITEGALDTPGSFYYGEDGVHLAVSDPAVDGEDAASDDDPVAANSETVTLSAAVHNIGVDNVTDADVILDVASLEEPGHDWYDDLEQEIDRTYGQEGTVTWELNRSLLLQGDHAFTVSTDDDEATGYFTTGEAGVDPGDTELYVSPGTEINVSVLGTELGYPADSCWGGPCDYQVDWAPAFANVYTQPVDEENEPTGDPVRHETDWTGQNLNKHSEDRLNIYEYGFQTEERVALMLHAHSYARCSNWEVGNTEQVQGDRYDHRECPSGSEWNQIVELTVDADTEEENVRVLNETRNTLPELDPGLDVQLQPDELLERPEVGIDTSVNEDGSVDVHLDENEFLFVFELTDHPEGGESADEYWERAAEEDGDPNFNDMLVHVDFSEAEDPANVGLEGTFDDEASDTDPTGVGNVDLDSPDETADNNVDTGNDHIVIG